MYSYVDVLLFTWYINLIVMYFEISVMLSMLLINILYGIIKSVFPNLQLIKIHSSPTQIVIETLSSSPFLSHITN